MKFQLSRVCCCVVFSSINLSQEGPWEINVRSSQYLTNCLLWQRLKSKEMFSRDQAISLNSQQLISKTTRLSKVLIESIHISQIKISMNSTQNNTESPIHSMVEKLIIVLKNIIYFFVNSKYSDQFTRISTDPSRLWN